MGSSDFKLDATQKHVQFYLTTTAPMLVGMNWAEYLTPDMIHNSEPPEQWQDSINQAWGIQNQTDLYRMIWRLAMMDVHGQDWQNYFSQFRCSLSSEWHSSFTVFHSPVEKAEQQFMDMVARLVGEEGFYAWDYVRGSYLVRSGLYTGWIPEEHATFFLNVIAHQAQNHFRSWDAYIRSYICGRAIWAFHSFDDAEQIQAIPALLDGHIESGFNSISSFYEHYESDSQCPLHWMPWPIPLPELMAPQSLLDVMNANKKESIK